MSLIARARVLASNRIVQFAALAGLVFALARAPASTRHIQVSERYLVGLREVRAVGQHAPLTSSDQAEVDARAVQDEILYREALRLGLDQGDPLIRQHLIQKMLSLAEDLGGGSHVATRDELRAFFTAAPERWMLPPRYHFIQAFHATQSASTAAALEADGSPAPGDPLPIATEVRDTPERLEAQFGPGFAAAVAALQPGEWSEPIASKYGWHRVKLIDVEPKHLAAFEEVEGRVRLADALDRRQRAVRDFLAKAQARYRVEVEGVSSPTQANVARVALRAGASSED